MWGNVDIYLKVLKVLFVVTSCQARVLETPRQARLSLAEPMPYYYYRDIDGHPGTYSFGYDVSDVATGNTQFRTEERYPNGTVIGSYGHVDALGKPHRFRYIADERGYRVMQDPPNKAYGQPSMNAPHPSPETGTTEPSVTWTRPSKRNNKHNLLNNHEIQKRIYINKLNDVKKYPSYSLYV